MNCRAAFGPGTDWPAIFLISDGIAEVRSSETGKLVEIIDLEMETAGEARFCYRRENQDVLIAEAGTVRRLSLNTYPNSTIETLFKTRQPFSDPAFLDEKWLLSDRRSGCDVYGLDSGARVLESPFWDILPFPHLGRFGALSSC